MILLLKSKFDHPRALCVCASLWVNFERFGQRWPASVAKWQVGGRPTVCNFNVPFNCASSHLFRAQNSHNEKSFADQRFPLVRNNRNVRIGRNAHGEEEFRRALCSLKQNNRVSGHENPVETRTILFPLASGAASYPAATTIRFNRCNLQRTKPQALFFTIFFLCSWKIKTPIFLAQRYFHIAIYEWTFLFGEILFFISIRLKSRLLSWLSLTSSKWREYVPI